MRDLCLMGHQYHTSRDPSPYKKKIKEINKILEGLGDAEFFERGKTCLEYIDKLEDAKTAGTLKLRNCPNLTRYQLATKASRKYEAVQLATQINKLRPANSQLAVVAQHEVVTSLIAEKTLSLFKKKPDQVLHQLSLLRDPILSLEKSIVNVMQSGESVSLTDIYRQFFQLFDRERFVNDIQVYIPCFIGMNEIDMALKRSQAFYNVLAENNDEFVPKVACNIAFIKTLLGDYSEWESIIKKEDEQKKRNAERKARQRKKQHEARVADIQAYIEDIEEAKETEHRQEEARLEVIEAGRQLQIQNAAAVSESAALRITETVDAPTTKAKKKKPKKSKNPAQVSDEKVEDEEVEESTDIHANAGGGRVVLADLNDQLPLYSLKDIYQFTSVAKRVDDAIESGTWKITRDNLYAYYEFMGCTQRSGKGSHGVIDLPASTLFIKAGQIVSVITDMSDHLSLPEWEGTIPHYLRKQILNTREKLAKIGEQKQPM